MDKELARCAKVERALEVMYKMYFVRESNFKAQLQDLNLTASKLSLNKDVFATFQMLESRSMTNRLSDLRTKLRRQEEKEHALQQRYFELQQELK